MTFDYCGMFQDVVTENEFEKRLLAEVIPPSDIGVTFDDIGALENVKETLKELVMLPLQRPELFCKGQLTKVPFIFLLCGIRSVLASIDYIFFFSLSVNETKLVCTDFYIKQKFQFSSCLAPFSFDSVFIPTSSIL